jgi:hypothetical protein
MDRSMEKPFDGASIAPLPMAGKSDVGVVTDEDRGRLFCYLDRDTIAERTGLSTRTVSTASSALAGRELVEKRTVRNQSGQKVP